MKFAHLSEVNAGYVREVYEYESVEEMREKNHPNFYHFIVPAPDEVQKFWMFKDGKFEEPKMFEVVNGHVYLPQSVTAEEIGTIFTKNLELEKREKLVDAALEILVSIFDTHPDLVSDEQANKMKNLYPEWGANVAYKVDTRIRYGEKLYKVLQEHTTQADWTPDVTPALYVVINETHAGTIDDPIPASRGMEYEYGKYYLDPEDGKTYLCERSGATGTIVLQYLPHELAGNYFTEVTEA